MLGNSLDARLRAASKVSLSQLYRPLLEVANASRKPRRYSPNRFANRKATPFSKQSLAHAVRVLAPTLFALTFATVAHAQGMDFSGAQTLMGTFKAFAIYAGAVIRSVMHLMFECATRWELFNERRNPIALVRVKGGSKRRQRPTTLTVEEFELVVATLAEPWRTMVQIAQCLGLRVSEIAALQWDDFDFDKNQLPARPELR
jgi:integrase